MIEVSSSVTEWRLVYRLLHAQLLESEELMSSDIMEQLQTKLQAAATADGVDVGDHAQWDTWLHQPAAPGGSSLKLVE